MRIAFEEFEAFVDAGAAHFDQVVPLWYIDVNLMLLDMRDPETCIVGQLGPSDRFYENTEILGVDEKLVLFGLDLPYWYVGVYGPDDYEILNVLWTKAITERRAHS